MRILFMGTPDFAIPSLNMLLENNYDIVGVVTAPDKPAGRGKKIQQSPIKRFAQENGLTAYQPEKLRDEEFIQHLRNLKIDLMVVVAFRMLPEAVWNMPKYGTFNLHASLLPQYRGAAPINWAIINGENETGATTFFIDKEIDTGKVMFREKVSIGPNETAGELHDKLMELGANLVLKTVQKIERGEAEAISQDAMKTEELKPAPKISKEDCRINWNKQAQQIHNLIRGMSPFPGAWTELSDTKSEKVLLKIYKANFEIIENQSKTNGSIETDGKTYLKIAVSDGYINIAELQLQGKKRMLAGDFLRGFQGIGEFAVVF